MSTREEKLNEIRAREQEAFKRKQEAWAAYVEAKERTAIAYDVMEDLWEERSEARDELNREYEAIQALGSSYHEIWGEYNNLRERNGTLIEALRTESNQEHLEMKRCFVQANKEYEHGDKFMAPFYSREGYDHKKRRDELNAQISDLYYEIREAKKATELRAPKADSSAFRAAKEKFDDAKERHGLAKADFKRLKAERECKKADFEYAQAEHKSIREELYELFEEMRHDI